MTRKLAGRMRPRNLVVLGVAGSLVMGGASAALASDTHKDPYIVRREDIVDADVALLDDDLDDGLDDPTSFTIDRATADDNTRDRADDRRDATADATRDATGETTGPAAGDPNASWPQQLDTGDATRSNDGTIGGATTANDPDSNHSADGTDPTGDQTADTRDEQTDGD